MLEILLVLSLVMTVSGLAIPSYQALSVKKEEDRFFDGLIRDIYFAQAESYRTKTSVMVVFREQEGKYEVVQSFTSILPARKLPATVKLKADSNLKSISFSANGSVTNAGTLLFHTSVGEKSLIVHLGKGRLVFSG